MNTWQPIETAPTNGDSVLLYYGTDYYVMEGRCFKRERGYRKHVYYHWVAAIDMGELEPTHWMPLPEPPVDPKNPDDGVTKLVEALELFMNSPAPTGEDFDKARAAIADYRKQGGDL